MERVKNFFQHLFTPTEHNNYRAKSLHTDFLMVYLVIAFVMSFVFKKIGYTNILGFATDISVDKLYQLINQEREKTGLPVLTYNDKLSTAASLKAQDMFAKNYWAHFAPDGKTPWDFILNSGYQYEYAGENLAKNFLFSDGVVSAWMNSQTHRDNILKREYTEVGYAIVNGTLNGEQTTMVVQMFGKPIVSPIAKQPETNQQPAININKEVIAEETVPQNQLVLAQNNKKAPINFPVFTFNINMIFFSFLLLALALDFYFAAKFHIIRVGGKNPAHFIFILFILIGLLIASRGAII
ncbi:MAG: CAP domain-containing protein [Candidatus Roizmanbacteria bacterium]